VLLVCVYKRAPGERRAVPDRRNRPVAIVSSG
jgi:hypothetical protein